MLNFYPKHQQIWKFKQIYLNLCSLVLTKEIIFFFQIKFAFWQEKSRKLCWILYFDRKNPAKWLEFFFDGVKIQTNLLEFEFVFKKRNKYDQYLQFAFIYFSKKEEPNWFEFCVLTSEINFFLTGKIQQIDLNFCSDVQCLKSQTFFNSCAKNRLGFFAKVNRIFWLDSAQLNLLINYKNLP